NVNVSPRQFRGGQFEQVVARALEKTGFPAAYLEIEITESLLVDDLPGVARSLERLREMGVGIALDDFGTGYSALNYLLQFPIGTLKIDRSITQTVTQTPRHRALVEGLLRLAEGQELITVVEGVETCDQLEALRDMNCHQVQGFAFGRPEPAEALTNRLRESERLEPRPA
ncbi:MAG TPA: EAL domain-containing protein, partial [Gammaproteobacteria bacterium]|nr:EAL domain-containing protein [Gammaproteobacteria bacterium]